MDDPHNVPRPDRILDGQPYWRLGERPHTTRDGRAISLTIWRSFCAACGKPFEFAFTSANTRFEPSRRCESHRMPGVKVGSRSARKRIAADQEEAIAALEIPEA